MKNIPVSIMMVAVLTLSACGSSANTSPTQPSTSDQVATVVAATVQAPSTSTAEPAPELPTVDACQVPTFKASDMPSDCFNGSGEPEACAALDLLEVEVSLLMSQGENPFMRYATGFVITFAGPPQAGEEFVLNLYLDLDQDPTTGFDMSSGTITLPGIDRLIGVTLPAGGAWTQAVAKGGYDAEIIRDEALVSASVVGESVTVVVTNALLLDKSVMAEERIQPTPGSVVTVRHLLGGGVPDAFTLYIGTAGSMGALDYFNGDPDFRVPLAMTVPEDIFSPPCVGGS